MYVWAMSFGISGRGVCLSHVIWVKGAACMFEPYQSGKGADCMFGPYHLG